MYKVQSIRQKAENPIFFSPRHKETYKMPFHQGVVSFFYVMPKKGGRGSGEENFTIKHSVTLFLLFYFTSKTQFLFHISILWTILNPDIKLKSMG